MPFLTHNPKKIPIILLRHPFFILYFLTTGLIFALFHDFFLLILFLLSLLFIFCQKSRHSVFNRLISCSDKIALKVACFSLTKLSFYQKLFLFRFARFITFVYGLKNKIKGLKKIPLVNKADRPKKPIFQTIKEKAENEPVVVSVKSPQKEEIWPEKKENLWAVKIEKERKIDPAKDHLLAPNTVDARKESFWQRAGDFFKDSFFKLRPSKKTVFIFILAITLGTFAFSVPHQTEDKFIKLLPIEQSAKNIPAEGKILGEKQAQPENKAEVKKTLTFKDLIGQLFAAIALTFGAIFFLYSLKYYLTSVIVLVASRTINHNGKNGRFSSFFYRLFFRPNGSAAHGLNEQNSVGFLPDLKTNGEIKTYPFISVHLPFYNEKKVANRILTACTSFDYPAYEIIVADDSVDETTEILSKWKNHPRVKLIHRENRQGFKGGALAEALKVMDKRTEFVIVFDADFIPYPDTLKQFLKYFQFNGNGNGFNNNHQNNSDFNYKQSNIAAVQGYQWHVLNKNENWITRSVRSEFAGSYVIERAGTELIGSLKQIAGSVYMIRSDVLKAYGWTNSITEDFELTLRIYRDGWKVIYTPYIQAPAECVSTIKRLIRQRMRWAEGHTSNVRRYFWSILKSPFMSRREKLEFLYLSPYYLQSFFLLVGTLAWFISDIILHSHLPFWTALWGWSLVFVNLLALPLLNTIGLFFEESPERDYLGIFSFVALTYIVAPFQALAALRGLFKKEGPWFRTPKSGHITDLYFRSKYRRWFKALFPKKAKRDSGGQYLKLATSHSNFQDFKIRKRKRANAITNIVSLLLITATLALQFLSFRVKTVPEELSLNQNQEKLSFVALNQDHILDTKKSETLAKVNEITQFSPAELEDNLFPGVKTIGKKQNSSESTATKIETGQNVPAKGQINRPLPEGTDAGQLPGVDKDNPNFVNLPSGPALIKEDLPEKVKEAVKTAFNSWPEGQNEVELTSLRTEKSKQILTEEGQIRQEIGAAPLHYADENGQWQDISTEIKPVEGIQITSADTYQYANTTNNFQTYFKADEANPEYVKFEYKGKEISFSLPSAISTDAKPTVENNIITYPEVYPGVDLRYTIYLDSVLEEYIVKTREALANLPILSQEFSAPNTNFAQEGDKLQFRDNLAGAKLWHFPKPVIYELNNQEKRTYGLHREVESRGETYLSKKILDLEALNWLSSSARKFPVVIDESYTVDETDTNYSDGHIVYDGSNYTKNSTDTYFKIGGSTTPEPDESYRGWIRFDISDFSDSVTYQQVDLYVTTNAALGTGDTVDIIELEVDPDGGGVTAQNIWDDIGDASNDVYVNDSTSFTTASAQRYFLLGNTGEAAVTNLNSALAGDWFGVGFKSSDETTDTGTVYAEELASASFTPRLAGLYNVIDVEKAAYLGAVTRASFFDPKYGKYWVIAIPGTSRTGHAWYSDDDGATWTEDSASSFTTGLSAANNSANIWFQEGSGGTDGKVYVVWYYSGSLYFISGTVGSTAITWGTKYKIGNWSYFSGLMANVTLGTDGICWAAAKEQNTNYEIKAVKSDDSNCNTWSETAQSTTITSANIDTDIVPLDDADVYQVWSGDSNLYGRRWNGSSWEDIDNICTSCVSTGSSVAGLSMVVDENYDIHLVYMDESYDIAYRRYDSSAGTWGNDYAIDSDSDIDYYPNISLDTSSGDIYAVYIVPDPLYGRKLNYYKCDYQAQDCLDSSDWGSETTLYTGFALGGSIGASYKADGRVWFVYQEGLYGIDVSHLIIPENVWLLIPFIAILPKQIQKLISIIKGRKKKKKSSLRLTSIFGMRKRK